MNSTLPHGSNLHCENRKLIYSIGETSTSNPMTIRLPINVSIALLLAPALPLRAQDHPRAPQQSQAQQLPQARTGAPQAAMTEATMSNVSAGLKEFISGYAAKSPDKKFHIPYQRKDLALDLVKVHDDRFSSLGGNKYFACVDMKGKDGRMYDIDFFMNVQPDKLTVTETSVHKINGKPLYNWKEQKGHLEKSSRFVNCRASVSDAKPSCSHGPAAVPVYAPQARGYSCLHDVAAVPTADVCDSQRLPLQMIHKMPKTFFITTAIDYTNSSPHVGHAYEKVLADVIARYHRLKGEKVFFLTGVDQHGQKVQQSAAKAGVPPAEFVKDITQKFIDLWKKLDVQYDDWAETTSDRHKKVVQGILQRLFDEGQIYKDKQSGYYSVRQEQFLTDKERGPDGQFGPEWGEIEFREEENYYFQA